MSEVKNPTPNPLPEAERGLSAPPSLTGKGAGGLGSPRLRIAALVLVGAAGGFAVWYFALREPEPRNDLERFRGDWKIGVTAGGETRETQNVVHVSGDRWEYVGGTTVGKAYRVTLNEAADPKEIDLELLDTAGLRGPAVKMHGVYAFDGNKTVRVRLGPASEPRPTTLDDPDADVLVLTKVKLEQDTQPKK